MPTREHLSERALGYKLHTNRELGLILRGEKPFASFSDVYEGFPDALLRYFRIFDRYVDRGVFVKREFLAFAGRRALHPELYTLPSEDWRIDALLDVYLQRGSWTIERERAVGTLLGYTDWQNDLWIAHVRAENEMPWAR